MTLDIARKETSANWEKIGRLTLETPVRRWPYGRNSFFETYLSSPKRS
jgi:hypothetical protein